jgi:hypothetical protein
MALLDSIGTLSKPYGVCTFQLSSQPTLQEGTMSKDKKPPAHKQAEEEQTRERAYYIWEKAGRPEGRDLEHWLVAKTEEVSATEKKASRRTTKKSTRKKAPVVKKAGKKTAAKKKTTAKSKKKAPKTS